MPSASTSRPGSASSRPGAPGFRTPAPPSRGSRRAAGAEWWGAPLTAVGSLTAVQGVTVAAELPGKVVHIAFEPGAKVERGDLLIRQDTSAEEAQLPGAVAQANLARTVLARDAEMLAEQIISQAAYDTSVANSEQTTAQANKIRATNGKKTIRAPFNGRLGIRQVNLGRLLREGDTIVTLPSLDPIFVAFTLPQQELARLRPGLPVRVTCDCLPGPAIQGRITAVRPLAGPATRTTRRHGAGG